MTVPISGMISVEDARERILQYFSRLEPERAAVLDALGQVLAEDVFAPFDLPPLDNTGMDGYAVRTEDTEGASPETPRALRVVADLAAGYVHETPIEPGEAVRIMTGAPIPPGADAVVPFEETDEPLREPNEAPVRSGTVNVLKAARLAANIRRRGEDVQEGICLMQAGRVVRASEVAVLASVGLAEVTVYRRPVVAILSTGDELVEAGQPLRPGQIYDANALGLAALVKKNGGIPRILGIARDSVEAVQAKVREGLAADMLVTSAGVSRGDFDVVKDVLAREGAIDFWTVRMRPGKPLAFGSFPAPDGRRVPHLGLPGNPVSAMVSFELFGRPAIFRMLGRDDWKRPTIRAVAKEGLRRPDERRFFGRCLATLGEDGRWYADLTGPQGSGMLTGLSAANGLAVMYEDQPLIAKGDEVEVMMLDWDHAP